MKTNETKLTQWKKRVLCVRFIYSILLINPNKDDAIEKFQDEILPLNDNDINRVLTVFFNRRDSIIKLIESKLSETWSLDRLNYVDLSIIIQAVCEQIALNTEKKIIIDQAIITSKKYSEKNSYKFINSILDKILK